MVLLRSLFGLLCLGAVAGPVSAQTSGLPLQLDVDVATPGYVNLINIEVSVKNANGDPVTDLTREDFRILDDGEPVEITNFRSGSRKRVSGVGTQIRIASIAAISEKSVEARNFPSPTTAAIRSAGMCFI